MNLPQGPPNGELLRFSTAGSVDDGKSTLIGRLLYDTKQILQDQLAAVERASQAQGIPLNLALLLDGLRAEREQGITIDVAYRFFATPRRRFIIADTPGHVQYTRNMATGASTANLALILIDVCKGVTRQSRRHALMASLLGVKHFVVCVNKMDLAGFAPEPFLQIKKDFSQFAARLKVTDIVFIPVSALLGDNVAGRSSRMPWYEGPYLLYHLENVFIAGDQNLIDLRFPVQYVIHSLSGGRGDYRGYAGQVAGGILKPGEEVFILPAGLQARIESIDTFDGAVNAAVPGMSVSVRLKDHIDVSRGDMICRINNKPAASQDLEALLCWMDETPLKPGKMYALKHTTRLGRALVKDLRYRLDVDSLNRDTRASSLSLNEIGRAVLRTTIPLFYDSYTRNRITGSFILIDEVTNRTSAAGMIL